LTIPEQIRTLEELAAADAELKTLEEQLTQERTNLNALKANLKKLEEKLGADRAQMAQSEKTKNELALDVRTMMQQIEHSREKLNRSRTEREANAAQREMEELRKLVRDREEEIAKLTAEGDTIKTQIDATEAEAKTVEGELGASEGDINSRLGEFEKTKAQRQVVRDAIAKKLPPVLYRRYETIRAKKGVGIAQTTDGTCKACNMSLPPQLFTRLRREPLLEQCPSCQRIIYFVAPQAAAPAERD
jgi:predicted  nucleic acid-binding Zn-ribbon protein